MAGAFHGKSGAIWWDCDTRDETAELFHITGWTCNVTRELADATIMTGGAAAGEWEQSINGFTDWTASVECNTDDADLYIRFDKTEAGAPDALGQKTVEADEDGETAVLEMWLDETEENLKILSGDAICVGISSTLDKDDVSKTTYAFQGTGVLAYVTANPG